MLKADKLLLSMKDEADALIQDASLKKLLAWAKEKTTPDKIRYKPGAVRAFSIYFVLALYHSDHFLDSSSGHSLHESVLNSSLDLAIKLTFNIDYLNSIQDRYLAHTFAHNLDLSNVNKLNITESIKEKLAILEKRLPGKSYLTETWTKFSKEPEQLMLTNSELYSFKLSYKKLENLSPYLYANRLIVDCLNHSTNVSDEVREEILDTLLIPPALQRVTL